MSFCWLEPELAGNPVDRFFRVEAHFTEDTFAVLHSKSHLYQDPKLQCLLKDKSYMYLS